MNKKDSARGVLGASARALVAGLSNRVLGSGLASMLVLLSMSAAMAQPGQNEATTPGTAIAKVCTECHSLEIVMDTPKDYDAWHITVQQMIDRGARGTEDEFGLVMQYLYENMTTIDVNDAGEDDLTTILHTTKPVAEAIMARRAKAPFKNLADLESVAGLDKSVLEAKKRMIFFQ